MCLHSLFCRGVFHVLVRCNGSLLYGLLLVPIRISNLLNEHKCISILCWAYSWCPWNRSCCLMSVSGWIDLIGIYGSGYVLRSGNTFLRKCTFLWMNNHANLRTSFLTYGNEILTSCVYSLRWILSFLNFPILTKCNFHVNLPSVCEPYLRFLK